MLPTGMAGIGLLNLRFSMAAVLVDFAAHRSPLPSRPSWRLPCRQSHYASDRSRPYASIITCLIELIAALRYGGQYVFNLITPALILPNWECGVPSYSLDSRLFESSVSKFEAKRMAFNDHCRRQRRSLSKVVLHFSPNGNLSIRDAGIGLTS
jgi:hypothetical protein